MLVHRCIKGICGEEGGSPTTRLEERNVHYHMTIEHQILHDVHTVVIVMKLEVLDLCQLLCKGFSCWRLILCHVGQVDELPSATMTLAAEEEAVSFLEKLGAVPEPTTEAADPRGPNKSWAVGQTGDGLS